MVCKKSGLHQGPYDKCFITYVIRSVVLNVFDNKCCPNAVYNISDLQNMVSQKKKCFINMSLQTLLYKPCFIKRWFIKRGL